MREYTWVVGPFQCNCRLLVCPKTGEALLIDPGDEAQKIIKGIQSVQTQAGMPIRVKYLLHTHGHLDHIGAARKVKESLSGQMHSAKIALHEGDELLYQNLKMQGQLFSLEFDDPLPIDHFIEDEEVFQVGEMSFQAIHTPGHSPGSVCFQFSDRIYSGDTLFQGSVGRTDLWGGDSQLLIKSIRQRLLSLDDDFRVCPGHGPDTRIGIEKRQNPFLV